MANHEHCRITRAAARHHKINPKVYSIDDKVRRPPGKKIATDLRIHALERFRTLRVSLEKADENHAERSAGQLGQVSGRQLGQTTTKLAPVTSNTTAVARRDRRPVTRSGLPVFIINQNNNNNGSLPVSSNQNNDKTRLSSASKRKASPSQAELEQDALERCKTLRVTLQRVENYSKRDAGHLDQKSSIQRQQFAAKARRNRLLKQKHMEEPITQGVQLRQAASGLDMVDKGTLVETLRQIKLKVEEDQKALRAELEEAREWRKMQGDTITKALEKIAELIAALW